MSDATRLSDLRSQRERELDLARLALHLREAAHAARRLGIRTLLRELGAGVRVTLMVEVLKAAAGVESVPALKLEETPHATARVAVLELYEGLRDELNG